MTAPGLPPFGFHLATPGGEGGIAVFELYGRGAEAVVAALFRGRGLPDLGRSRLGVLVDAEGEEIDEVLVSRLPADGMWCRLSSWTVSVHGGPWIQERVRALLGGCGGSEWSRSDVLRRSVREGALDAVRCAAFEYLVDARTERAAAFFARQHDGELSRRIEELARACAEKGPSRPPARERVEEGLVDLLRGAGRAFRLGHPLRLLIAGRPNSGKSTLFNALVERERVVVSADRGTTRDLIRETVAFEGFPVELMDSAGLRSDPSDPVEREAVREVWRRHADAVLYLSAPPWRPGASEEAFLDRFPAGRAVRVAGFRDLGGAPPPGPFAAFISARTGEGLDGLRREVVRRWLEPDGPHRHGGVVDSPAPFTETQRRLLERALESLGARGGEASGLDAVRELLIMVLRSSWPPNGIEGADAGTPGSS